MITTTTYRERTGGRQDLLAAYSAFDYATTASLGAAEVDVEYRRLLTRLSVLLYLHGPNVADSYLAALDYSKVDPVELTAAFLEKGGPPCGPAGPSELQQELVHFSRIVDVRDLELANVPDARRAARRLRNSQRIPTGLKVLSELIIVARSRILARGGRVQLPRLRGEAATRDEVSGDTTLWHGDDYVLVVSSPRRRARHDTGYLTTALLEYLTPAEATLAVWAHTMEHEGDTRLAATLLEITSCGDPASVSWARAAGGSQRPETWSAAEWCRKHLPVRAEDKLDVLADCIHGPTLEVTDRQERRLTVTISGHNGVDRRLEVQAAEDRDRSSLRRMMNHADDLIGSYNGAEITSIECGHIHLDRDLDIDQEVGAMLGVRALHALTRRQSRTPVLTPMMDDDHVLVKLRPKEYRRFLQDQFDESNMYLVAESSPVVRAIVTAMWWRLRERGLAARTRERGRNLFLHLDDRGDFCELFENYRGADGELDGAAGTGCVFFETALLVYRSAPEVFDDFFRGRFDTDVHTTITQILDGPADHDTNVRELEQYYRQFSDVTNPHDPDQGVLSLVDEVLVGAGRGVAHLNVLEDYYEVQQEKVRAVLRLLDLPLRLVTLHFNIQTERLVIDG